VLRKSEDLEFAQLNLRIKFQDTLSTNRRTSSIWHIQIDDENINKKAIAPLEAIRCYKSSPE
jgi:hypothetical protein